MELSGRTPGYRGIAIRCPGCAEAMRAQALSEAEVDLCDACGGLWIDWFDGEIRAVTSEALTTALSGEATGRTSDLRSEPVALGACPRCTRQLIAERYVLEREAPASDGAAPRASSRTATGADLLRCEDCAGVFVSRASAETLATLPADDAPPPSAGPAVLDPLPWQRLVALLRRVLGLG